MNRFPETTTLGSAPPDELAWRRPGEVRARWTRANAAFGAQGQGGDQDDAAVELAIVLLGDAVDQVDAQPAEAEEGTQGGRRDHLDGRRAEARRR